MIKFQNPTPLTSARMTSHCQHKLGLGLCNEQRKYSFFLTKNHQMKQKYRLAFFDNYKLSYNCHIRDSVKAFS